MPKIVKIPLIVLASIVGLLLLLWAALQLSWTQQYIKNRLMAELSDGLGVNCTIGHIDIAYFDRVKLEDLLIPDQHGDTLIFAHQVIANYDLFNWERKRISFDRVEAERPQFHMRIYAGETASNLEFLLAYFKKDGPSDPTAILIEDLLVHDGEFAYIDENKEDSPDRDFNEANMRFFALEGELRNFEAHGDSVLFSTRSLSGRESCGLKITQMHGDCDISPRQMVFSHFGLNTPYSELQGHLEFHQDSYKDYSDFIRLVKMEARVQDSKLHSRDLAFFTDEMKVYDDLMLINGEGGGTVADLHFDPITARIGDHTLVQGAGTIRGLPETMDALWDLQIDDFETTADELIRLARLSDDTAIIRQLGRIGYRGTFTGRLNDFHAKGSMKTDPGTVAADVSLNMREALVSYGGSVRSEQFDLSFLGAGSDVGISHFDLTFHGQGTEALDMKATVIGDIHRLDYKGYPYTHMYVDGKIEHDLFIGKASIQDPNAQAAFDGSINISEGHSVTKAHTSVQHLNLQALGFTKDEHILELEGDVNVAGNHIDSLAGIITLENMQWYGSGEHIPIGPTSIQLVRRQSNQSLQVRSDLMDADVNGNFQLSQFSRTMMHVFEEVHSTRPGSDDEESVHADIRIKQFHPLLLAVSGGTSFKTARLALDFEGGNHQLRAEASLDQVHNSDIHTNQLDFRLVRNGIDNPAVISMGVSGFALGDSMLFRRMDLKAKVIDSVLQFGLEAKGAEQLALDLDGNVHFPSDSMLIRFDAFEAMINRKAWNLGVEDARIVYHDQRVDLLYFDFRSRSESIFFDGTFGQEANRINLILNNFLLENANPFLAGINTELNGVANGPVDLTFMDGFPIFESRLDIQDMALNGDTLGRFLFNSEYDSYKVLAVHGLLDEGLFSGMQIGGNVNFNRPDSSLNLTISTLGSSIRPFQKYIQSLASDLDGKVDADLKVIGGLNRPQVTGTAQFNDLSFTVNYLQTHYTGQALLDVTNNLFTIREAEVVDRRGKKGRARGTIRHKQYSDFVFDLTIDRLKDFLCLNTKRKDNELFYGTAYADGRMKIQGPLGDLLLAIDAKSKPGTRISIPLDNAEQSSQLNYVHFVDLSQDNNQLKTMVRTQEGVRMEFNFEVTNDAQVELIFDELLGDKIRGRAHGNLRMEINTYGEFNMFGGVTIDQGDYLFTAFNIINKYFVVEPGSTISWDGDIYDARLDLKAIKREYPRPSTLLAGFIDPEEADNYSTPIPVDCELILSGLLFNPDISFDLSLPSTGNIGSDATSTFNTVIGRVKQDQEELDRQVFSLLVLGTFMPPSFGTGPVVASDFSIQSSFNNSLSDFISAQLSNWLSQVDPKLQVGIDYQAAQAATGQLDPEIVLSLRRKIIYDMLEFQGSYDAGASNNNPFDLNLQIDLNEEGTFKARGFWRNANDPTLGNLNNVTTFGVGVFYRYQFDHFWFEKDRKRRLDGQDLQEGS